MQVWKRVLTLIILTFAICPVGDFTAQDEQPDACNVSAANDVNRRSAPGTNYDVAGTLAAGQTGVVGVGLVG